MKDSHTNQIEETENIKKERSEGDEGVSPMKKIRLELIAKLRVVIGQCMKRRIGAVSKSYEMESVIEQIIYKEAKKTILILGGSGGARTINHAVINRLEVLKYSNFQLIWQTGKFYYQQSIDAVKDYKGGNIKVHAFINKMDMAFVASDIVISRAGAGTISELCLVEKPSILVPSPNVAEDHQTKNAMALVEKDAAIMIKDDEAKEKLIDRAIELSKSNEQMNKLSKNIAKLAMNNSDERIADEILKLIKD